MDSSRVLITNADYKNALAVVRSLGKKGINITAASHKPLPVSFYSKYCNKRRSYYPPTENHKKFVGSLLNIVKEDRIEVLFPIGVDTTLPVSYFKEKFLPYTKVPIADYNILVKAHDKSLTLPIAKDIGIPIPETYYPESLEEVIEISEKIEYPTIIKRRKGSGVDDGVRLARSKDDLVKKYKEIESIPSDSLINEQKHPLIQEYIPGEIRDVNVLFNKGKPRAALAQRRIWTLPPDGGPGILNETINDPSLIDLSLKIMKEIKWHGLAQVEFKLDSNGKPRLMEINPKFWGTLELSIKAGIDFPRLLYEMTMYEDVEPVFTYEKLTFLWVFPSNVKYLLQSSNKVRDFKFYIEKLLEKRSATDISIRDLRPELVKPWNILILRARSQITSK